MYKKQTLFSFVYEDIKGQILTEVLTYGSKLPGAQQLCQFYDVGKRTIIAVVRALREEGLIQTTERGRATVIYRGDAAELADLGACTVLSRGANVLEVYRTMELLMPDILTFYTGLFDVIELKQYDNAVKWARRPTSSGQWRAVSALIHDILLTAGNPLTNNLYAALESFAEIPFITEGQEALTGYSPYQEGLGTRRMLDILRTDSNVKRHQEFSSYYHAVTKTVEMTFAFLCQKLPDVDQDTAREFSWRADRGRYPYYLQIARDIVQNIGLEIYPSGMRLPSETALAEQYGVSEDTAGKAVKYLNSIGFVRTHRRKGTYVIIPEWSGYRKYENKPGMLLYLNSLQLMALAIRPAALLVFDALDAKKLKQGFDRPKATPLVDMVGSIIEHMPLQPYKVILCELNNVINLGFYFSLYSYGKLHADAVTRISQEAFHYLEIGNAQRFAELLYHCYGHILNRVRDLLIQEGLSEAAQIVTP